MKTKSEIPSLEEMKLRGDNALHAMRLLVAGRQAMAALTHALARLHPRRTEPQSERRD